LDKNNDKNVENIPQTLDWVILLICGLIWGGAFFFIKKAVEIYEPMQATLLRMSISTIIYLPFGIYFFKKIDWSKWFPLVVVALCSSGLPNYFFAVAEKTVSSGVAGVLNSMVPLFTFLLGTIFFNMKPSRNKIYGILLGLAGVIVLLFFGKNDSNVSIDVRGAIFCLAGGLMYAINANNIGRYLQGMNPIAVNAGAFMISGIFYLVGAWKTGSFEVAMRPENSFATASVAYLAVIGTVIASVLYVWLVQRTSAIFATSVAYLFPIFSLLFGFLDGEMIGLPHLIGAGLVLGGLYLSRK
jgi:drug/metabolite transporter (DMT)-like permease